MPRIETDYTSQITNLPNVSPQAFTDTRGAQALAQGMGQVAQFSREQMQREIELRETEKQLAQARLLAEGKQQWMLDMDKRVADAEASGNYAGLIDNFDKDYTDWATKIIDETPEGNEREKMRVSLIELQTPFLGQASNYVAQQRGKKIKENNDAIAVALLKPVLGSKSESDLVNAEAAAEPILKTLRPEIAQGLRKDLSKAMLMKTADLVTNPEYIDQVKEDFSNIPGLTPAELESGYNALDSMKSQKINQTKSDISENIGYLDKSSTIGTLQDGWDTQTRQQLEMIKPYDPDAYNRGQYTLSQITEQNKASRDIWGMGENEFSKKMSELGASSQSETDPGKKLSQEQSMNALAIARRNRDEALSKDYAQTVMSKDPMVKQNWEQYQNALSSGVDPATQKQALDKYVNSIVDYGKRVGWNGDVKLLPKEEVDLLGAQLKDALATKNGLNEYTKTIESYREKYGQHFGLLMRQLRKENAIFGPVSLLPRMSDSGDGTNSRVVRQNELVRILSAVSENPKIYDSASADRSNWDILFTPESETMIAAMSSAGMRDEITDRQETYNLAVKAYSVEQKSDPRKLAYDLAFGDIDVSGRIVYPKSVGDINQIISGARRMLKENDRFDLVQPTQSTEFDETRVMMKPEGFIEFVTNKDGSGLMGVWINKGSNGTEPVYKKNNITGKTELLEYKWGDALRNGFITPEYKKMYRGGALG